MHINTAQYSRLQRLKARRRVWLNVHLYLGLLAGAVLAVVGFTGAVLVFYEELQEVFNAAQIIVAEPQPSSAPLRTLDKIVAAADAVKPPGSEA